MHLLRRPKSLRPHRLALPALAVLICGCQMGGSQAALEGELRLRSEENTQLQLVIHDLEVELRECKRKLERQNANDNDEGNSGRRPQSESPDPPDVELGPAQGEDEGAPAPKFNPRRREPQDAPGPADGQASRRSRVDMRVVKLTVDPKRTSGWDADLEAPGDEGLLVVVEPRNAAGQLAPVAGQISIAAYDAELLEKHKDQANRGELAHIGTWQFNSQDAETWFLEDEDGSKMHFELRWPHEAPTARQVRIFVRYVTSDGRALQSNWSVVVNQDGVRGADVAETQDAPIESSQPSAAAAEDAPPVRSALRNTGAIRRPEWKPYR